MYMFNLVCMVLMCVLIVGVLVISLIIYLEGSLSVDSMLYAHLVIPACVLALNIYVILLEDHEEEKFFKSVRRGSESATGRGVVLVNLALIASFVSLGIAAYFKFVLGSQAQGEVSVYDEDYEDPYIAEGTAEKVIFIEECLLHALAVIESVTLREYAKSKLKDIISSRKKK